MKRPEITKMLSDLLVSQRLSGLGKYYAKEVSIDYGTTDVTRVDFMEFCPQNGTIAGIEKGEFVCYEVKSCLADFLSGHGQNFITEKGYYVMPMSLLKELNEKQIERKFRVGVMCPVPAERSVNEEYDDPTPLSKARDWRMKIVVSAVASTRQKSVLELMFAMLRAGRKEE